MSGVAEYYPIGGGMLRKLVYRSKITRKMTSEDLIALGQECFKANSSLGLTGFLLVSETHFLQFIEGPDPAFTLIMEKIKKDPRHHDVFALSTWRSEEPEFSKCAMSMVSTLYGSLDLAEHDNWQAVPSEIQNTADLLLSKNSLDFDQRHLVGVLATLYAVSFTKSSNRLQASLFS